MDWEKLPIATLPLYPINTYAILLGGRVDVLKAMRGVSKTWKRRFDSVITCLRISQPGEALTPNSCLSERFPALTALDIGEAGYRSLNFSLAILVGFTSIAELTLGNHNVGPGRGLEAVAKRVKDADLAFLQTLPLTKLDLCGCVELTVLCLAHIRGKALNTLDLSGCSMMSDAGPTAALGALQVLQELPLTRLALGGWQRLSNATLTLLTGLPLTSLSLTDAESVTDPGLYALRDIPLQRLDLSYCVNIPALGLAWLDRMPLTNLSLRGCRLVSDNALWLLRKKQLASLDLHACEALTGSGLQHLQGRPLTSLELGRCPLLVEVNLRHLSGLPLTHLSLEECPCVSEYTKSRLRNWGIRPASLCLDGCDLSSEYD